jgi:cation diffusion facilitator CzcD-associated flavoprotein CzcO
MLPETTEVLIIGAGPTGMALSIVCTRPVSIMF